jgi:hypothetical protein
MGRSGPASDLKAIWQVVETVLSHRILVIAVMYVLPWELMKNQAWAIARR